MSNKAKNTYLHFHVRHDGYGQSPGYGHFLAYVLNSLNKSPPESARDLLIQTAQLLKNEDRKGFPHDDPRKLKRNEETFINCLPGNFRRTLKRKLDIKNDSISIAEEVLAEFFSNAADPRFGVLVKDMFEYSLNRVSSTTKAAGVPFVTEILVRGEGLRGYFDTLAKYYDIDKNSVPADFNISFDYTVPGRYEERLQLMRIGTISELETHFKALCEGDQDYIDEHMWRRCAKDFEGDNTILFLHPCISDTTHGSNFDKLVRSLSPLLEVIDTPPEGNVAKKTPLPQEKKDAIATVYWLLAQSTPVLHGGSAYANVVLHHLADRVKNQGYDYNIPYNKEGIDLWAEAVALPLEDGKIQGFKSRFNEGQFFDLHATDKDIEQYLHDRLQRKTPVIGYQGTIQQGL